ncbi:hypothetical protein K9M48_05565 [Candidatus Gracilibacteria bacterium]|nr:hypothetical protein [Candidatus Gracilibacteria bacterium]
MEISQRENLFKLAKCGGFKFTDKWFPYTSGWIGPYYVQSMDICKTGLSFQTAIHGITEIVEGIIFNSGEAIDVISGGESRDWPFSFPIADNLGIAPLMIYKDGKKFGPDLKGKRVLHIADLNNEGSSPRDKWIPAIRNAGGIITDIVFFVDRLEDGVQVMKDLGLKSHAVISLNEESWNFLKENDFINQEILDSLLNYWKDRKAWGIKKLLEHPEILLDMLKKEKEAGLSLKNSKGFKIFDIFYPLIGEELPKTLGFENEEEFKKNFI